MLVYVFLTVLAYASAVYSTDVECPERIYSSWVKLNQHTVCVEAKNNGFGSFNNYVRDGQVVGIKLEYVSGAIRCIGGVAYNSRWGCSSYAPFDKYPLDIVVTDNNNNLLFPKKEHIKLAAGLWYWSPFVSTTSSNEIVFTDYRLPFFFPKDKEMRIWYGEDLMNWAEGDNAGRVCVNVYAKFIY